MRGFGVCSCQTVFIKEEMKLSGAGFQIIMIGFLSFHKVSLQHIFVTILVFNTFPMWTGGKWQTDWLLCVCWSGDWLWQLPCQWHHTYNCPTAPNKVISSIVSQAVLFSQRGCWKSPRHKQLWQNEYLWHGMFLPPLNLNGDGDCVKLEFSCG